MSAVVTAQTGPVDERHLIPEGYTGFVTIVFGVPSAPRASASARIRNYRVPPSGFLLVREDPPVTVRTRQYYWVRADGSLKAFPGREPAGETAGASIVTIYNHVRNRMAPGGGQQCEAVFDGYFVGTGADLQRIDYDAQRRKLYNFIETAPLCAPGKDRP